MQYSRLLTQQMQTIKDYSSGLINDKIKESLSKATKLEKQGDGNKEYLAIQELQNAQNLIKKVANDLVSSTEIPILISKIKTQEITTIPVAIKNQNQSMSPSVNQGYSKSGSGAGGDPNILSAERANITSAERPNVLSAERATKKLSSNIDILTEDGMMSSPPKQKVIDVNSEIESQKCKISSMPESPYQSNILSVQPDTIIKDPSQQTCNKATGLSGQKNLQPDLPGLGGFGRLDARSPKLILVQNPSMLSKIQTSPGNNNFAKIRVYPQQVDQATQSPKAGVSNNCFNFQQNYEQVTKGEALGTWEGRERPKTENQLIRVKHPQRTTSFFQQNSSLNDNVLLTQPHQVQSNDQQLYQQPPTTSQGVFSHQSQYNYNMYSQSRAFRPVIKAKYSNRFNNYVKQRDKNLKRRNNHILNASYQQKRTGLLQSLDINDNNTGSLDKQALKNTCVSDPSQPKSSIAFSYKGGPSVKRHMMNSSAQQAFKSDFLNDPLLLVQSSTKPQYPFDTKPLAIFSTSPQTTNGINQLNQTLKPKLHHLKINNQVGFNAPNQMTSALMQHMLNGKSNLNQNEPQNDAIHPDNQINGFIEAAESNVNQYEVQKIQNNSAGFFNGRHEDSEKNCVGFVQNYNDRKVKKEGVDSLSKELYTHIKIGQITHSYNPNCNAEIDKEVGLSRQSNMRPVGIDIIDKMDKQKVKTLVNEKQGEESHYGRINQNMDQNRKLTKLLAYECSEQRNRSNSHSHKRPELVESYETAGETCRQADIVPLSNESPGSPQRTEQTRSRGETSHDRRNAKSNISNINMQNLAIGPRESVDQVINSQKEKPSFQCTGGFHLKQNKEVDRKSSLAFKKSASVNAGGYEIASAQPQTPTSIASPQQIEGQQFITKTNENIVNDCFPSQKNGVQQIEFLSATQIKENKILQLDTSQPSRGRIMNKMFNMRKQMWKPQKNNRIKFQGQEALESIAQWEETALDIGDPNNGRSSSCCHRPEEPLKMQGQQIQVKQKLSTRANEKPGKNQRAAQSLGDQKFLLQNYPKELIQEFEHSNITSNSNATNSFHHKLVSTQQRIQLRLKNSNAGLGSSASTDPQDALIQSRFSVIKAQNESQNNDIFQKSKNPTGNIYELYDQLSSKQTEREAQQKPNQDLQLAGSRLLQSLNQQNHNKTPLKSKKINVRLMKGSEARTSLQINKRETINTLKVESPQGIGNKFTIDQMLEEPFKELLNTPGELSTDRDAIIFQSARTNGSQAKNNPNQNIQGVSPRTLYQALSMQNQVSAEQYQKQSFNKKLEFQQIKQKLNINSIDKSKKSPDRPKTQPIGQRKQANQNILQIADTNSNNNPRKLQKHSLTRGGGGKANKTIKERLNKPDFLKRFQTIDSGANIINFENQTQPKTSNALKSSTLSQGLVSKLQKEQNTEEVENRNSSIVEGTQVQMFRRKEQQQVAVAPSDAKEKNIQTKIRKNINQTAVQSPVKHTSTVSIQRTRSGKVVRIQFQNLQHGQCPSNNQILQSVHHLQKMTGRRYQCAQMLGTNTIILVQCAGPSSDADRSQLNDDIAMTRNYEGNYDLNCTMKVLRPATQSHRVASLSNSKNTSPTLQTETPKFESDNIPSMAAQGFPNCTFNQTTRQNNTQILRTENTSFRHFSNQQSTHINSSRMSQHSPVVDPNVINLVGYQIKIGKQFEKSKKRESFGSIHYYQGILGPQYVQTTGAVLVQVGQDSPQKASKNGQNELSQESMNTFKKPISNADCDTALISGGQLAKTHEEVVNEEVDYDQMVPCQDLLRSAESGSPQGKSQQADNTLPGTRLSQRPSNEDFLQIKLLKKTFPKPLVINSKKMIIKEKDNRSQPESIKQLYKLQTEERTLSAKQSNI